MNEFLAMLDGVSDAWVYVFLFAGAFIENLVPPVPGDTVVIAGAVMVGYYGRLNAGVTYAVTTAGSLGGFMTVFALGYSLGRPYFERRNFRWFPTEAQQRVERWFDRYGLLIILANRFFAGARAIISLFAGLGRMPPGRVALLALVSCAVWNALLIGGGVYLGRNWRLMTDIVSKYNNIVLGVVAFALASYLVVRYLRRRGSAESGTGLSG